MNRGGGDGKIFADCSTNNVGISAVWSAFAGFIFLAWWRIKHLSEGVGGARGEVGPKKYILIYATLASLVAWMGVCVYYSIVEEAMTTVAHLVAFCVGAWALLLFEVIYKTPRDVGNVFWNRPEVAGRERNAQTPLLPPPCLQLQNDRVP